MNRKFIAAFATTALVLTAGIAGAQTYTLTVAGPSSVAVNNAFSCAVTLDFDGATNMSGWSYGVCNDTNFVTCTDSADGAIIPTINGGNPPGFVQGNDFAEGFTVGIVIDLLGANSLAPGTGYELSIGNYTADAEVAATDIMICSTLGTPPVDAVVVINGQSIVPVMNSQTVEITGLPPVAFTYSAPDVSANYNPSDGAASFDVSVTIDQDDTGAPDALTQGFSLGLSHDPALFSVTGVVTSLGFTPGFEQIGLADTNGWTAGIVYDLLGGIEEVLQNFQVATASYETVAANLVGVDPAPAPSALAWSNGIGTPPVDNVVVVDGGSLNANFSDGSVTLNAVAVVIVDFRRGDANEDGIVNIADGIWILNALFQGGPTIDCDIASDANDDGGVDASDAAYIFQYRFMGGSPPPAPFPACGTDPAQLPAPDDCNSYNAC